jgi:hypothetical protein
MKYLQSYTLLILLMLLTWTVYPEENIDFLWTFLYKKSSGEIQPVHFKKYSTTCETGDKLKIYLRPIENAYMYLILFDAEEILYVLFPARMSFFDHYYIHNHTYTFPEGDEWAPLDNTGGTEEFILLVSSKRLKRLENLIDVFTRLSLTQNTAPGRRAAAQYDVIEEIQRLKNEYSQFRRKVKEKFIPVAVEMRDENAQEEIPMLEIKTDTFYTKTIRIYHNTGIPD